MHLKLVAAFALFAVCSATLLDTKNIYIAVNDDNILVKNKEIGNQVDIITRQQGGLTGQNIIQIRINGPEVSPKTVQVIDQQVTVGGRYQSEILYQIFKRYDGQVIDENTYVQLISTIAQLVEDDKVDSLVLRALQTVSTKLEGNEFLTNQIYRQQQPIYQRFINQQTPYNRWGYLQAQRGYLQGQRGYLQGQRGYLQGQRGYLQGQRGYLQTGLRDLENVVIPEGLRVGKEIEGQDQIRNILQRQQYLQGGLRGLDNVVIPENLKVRQEIEGQDQISNILQRQQYLQGGLRGLDNVVIPENLRVAKEIEGQGQIRNILQRQQYLQGGLRGLDNVVIPENLRVAGGIEGQGQIRNILQRQQYLQGGLRGLDNVVIPENLRVSQEIEGQDQIRNILQRQQYGLDVDTEYQSRYGLGQQLYGRGLGQTQRGSVLRNILFRTPEDRTIVTDRLTDDLTSLDNVVDPVQRQILNEIPTQRQRVDEVVLRRPQGLGLRQIRNQWTDRNIWNQIQREVPVQQRQWSVYGVPVSQQQSYNRYSDIVY